MQIRDEKKPQSVIERLGFGSYGQYTLGIAITHTYRLEIPIHTDHDVIDVHGIIAGHVFIA